MSTFDPHALQREAQWQYEKARWLYALRITWLIVPLTALSFVCCDQPAACCGLGILLLGVATLFRWHGQGLERVVNPAIALGSLFYALPLAMRWGGHGCIQGTCTPNCTIPCALLGVFLGITLVRWLLHNNPTPDKRRQLAAAGTITSLTAALACLPLGLIGILAMLLATLLSTTTFALLSPQTE